MDKKTSPKADEVSARHLTPQQSRSQAQGISEGELADKDRRAQQDPASREIQKRR